MVYKFFDKKTLGSGVTTLANNGRPLDISTQKLAEELHKLITKKIIKNSLF